MRTIPLFLVRLIVAAAVWLPARSAAHAQERPEPATGVASYYSSRLHGRPTASGEPYDDEGFTAAHRSLPFGTRLQVTNLKNGRSVVVRVNDRGPFHPELMIDVSGAAARRLDFVRAGRRRVRIEVLPDSSSAPVSVLRLGSSTFKVQRSRLGEQLLQP